MRKRVGVARAMAMDPEVLFFDEPSAGLDPVSARLLDDLILQLSDSLKTTMVVVTHELASIFAIASNSVFLDPVDQDRHRPRRPEKTAGRIRRSPGDQLFDPRPGKGDGASHENRTLCIRLNWPFDHPSTETVRFDFRVPGAIDNQIPSVEDIDAPTATPAVSPELAFDSSAMTGWDSGFLVFLIDLKQRFGDSRDYESTPVACPTVSAKFWPSLQPSRRKRIPAQNRLAIRFWSVWAKKPRPFS
jgi:hypothetical protein